MRNKKKFLTDIEGISNDTIEEILNDPNFHLISFKNVIPSVDLCKKLDESIFTKRQDFSIFISPRKEFDFNVLRFMPNLGRLIVWWEHLKDITFIESIKSLNEFDILYPTLNKVSLKPLAKHTRLKNLAVYGVGKKDLDVIYNLKALSYINLRFCAIDLQNMLDFDSLQDVEFTLSNIKNMHLISQIGRIRKMTLYSVKDLTDASFISDMKHLQHLELQNLNKITQLPDFKNCQDLKILHLAKLKQITNFENIKNLQNLEGLQFSDLKLGIDDVQFLSEMPNLKTIRGHIRHRDMPKFEDFTKSLGISLNSYSIRDLNDDIANLF